MSREVLQTHRRMSELVRSWAHTAWILLRAVAVMTLRWLRGSPATIVTCAILFVGALSYYVWPDQFSVLAAPTEPGAWWSLVTSIVALPGHLITAFFLGLIVMIFAGGAAERRIGTRTWVYAALGGHISAIVATWLTLPLIRIIVPTWGTNITEGALWGTSLIFVALAAACGESVDAHWRWRVRFLLLGILIVAAAVLGSALSYARIWAALAGIVVARFSGIHAPSERDLDNVTLQRQVASISVLCWAVAAALTVISATPQGPLADMRWTLTPAWWLEGRAGVVSTLLGLMPVLLQLLFAYGLRRGRRVAYVGTLLLQGLLAFSSITGTAVQVSVTIGDGQEIPAQVGSTSLMLLLPVALNIVLCVIVVWMRSSFPLHSDPGFARTLACRWGIVMLACVAAALLLGFLSSDSYISTVDVFNGGEAVTSVGPVDLLHDYLLALIPTATASVFEPSLIPLSFLAEAPLVWVPLIAWVGTLVLMGAALLARPHVPSADTISLADLIRTHGGGTLGWMGTWSGNQIWVCPWDEAGVAYRGEGGVALTVSEPVCAPGSEARVLDYFASFATRAGLTPALYSIHEPFARCAQKAGWVVLPVAEESLLDLPDLAFKGKAYQDVRTAMNHATREGVEARWTTWQECPDGWRDQIEAISSAWSQEKALPEMGFTLGGVRELHDPDTRILVAIDTQGTIHAVTSWLPVHREGRISALTLDVMRRRSGGWRPAIEFLIGRAALDAQAEGLEYLSLSGAPLTRPEGDSSPFGPLLDTLSSIMEPLYGFTSLHAFKRKFKPRTQTLYLAVPDVASLAGVGIAIAHAYVPSVSLSQSVTLIASVAGSVAEVTTHAARSVVPELAANSSAAQTPAHAPREEK